MDSKCVIKEEQLFLSGSRKIMSGHLGLPHISRVIEEMGIEF
ncbi:MAG: hypothetical protein RBG13Loki_4375 [Promethearchaeota archaeon CR_4]|nr:MAG: hypothetical protein RBG13Loki_4375 [Candidatus Lokiarchaeota archaeon CR_4]